MSENAVIPQQGAWLVREDKNELFVRNAASAHSGIPFWKRRHPKGGAFSPLHTPQQPRYFNCKFYTFWQSKWNNCQLIWKRRWTLKQPARILVHRHGPQQPRPAQSGKLQLKNSRKNSVNNYYWLLLIYLIENASC